MKGLDKEVLIKLLEVKNYDYYLEEDVEVIFKVFGDDYYINRDTGEQKEIEDVYIDCDGRCLNCDYYEPITSNCRVEED